MTNAALCGPVPPPTRWATFYAHRPRLLAPQADRYFAGGNPPTQEQMPAGGPSSTATSSTGQAVRLRGLKSYFQSLGDDDGGARGIAIHHAARGIEPGGVGHAGFVRSAIAILEDIDRHGILDAALKDFAPAKTQRIRKAFRPSAFGADMRYRDGEPESWQPTERPWSGEVQRSGPWSFVITGHSLGASAAGLLAMALRPRYPQLKAYLFAPGGTVDVKTAKQTEDFITSIVCNWVRGNQRRTGERCRWDWRPGTRGGTARAGPGAGARGGALFGPKPIYIS